MTEGSVRAEIGARVRAIRLEAGWTQQELSWAAYDQGLAWPAAKISALEAGRKAISVEELLALPGLIEAVTGTRVRVCELLPDPPASPERKGA